jgi:hypothetical protein
MIINPDKEYLERNNFNADQEHHLEKSSDFDGMVIFHEVDGEFIRGFAYQNGDPVHGIYKSEEDYQSRMTSSDGEGWFEQTNNLGQLDPCYWVTVWQIVIDYEVYYWGPTIIAVVIIGYSVSIIAEYLFCTGKGTGSSGGGGGGGGNPNPPNNVNEEKTPCEAFNEMLTNYITQEILKKMTDSTDKYNKEYGVIFDSNGNPFGPYGGVDGASTAPLSKAPYGGMFHSHNTGWGDIFSFKDLYSIGYLSSRNLIIQENFFYGLSGAGGSRYMLRVTNWTQYNGFMNNFFQGNIDSLIDKLMEDYPINTDSPSDDRDNFMRFLEDHNLPVEIYQGNDNFNDWQHIELDENNSAVNGDCE